MKFLTIFCLFCFPILLSAQDQTMDLPFREIPPVPESFSTGNVMARLVEGLGFRYYWATEDLTDNELGFKPSEDARSMQETIDHIHGLSRGVLLAVQKKPNEPAPSEELSFAEKRRQTLMMLEEASTILRQSEEKDFTDYNVVFKRGENSTSFPFWNLINGQISDAIYHVGQVVSFRRTAGNPMPKGVSVFRGTKR